VPSYCRARRNATTIPSMTARKSVARPGSSKHSILAIPESVGQIRRKLRSRAFARS
jgi:hypothetical protein